MKSYIYVGTRTTKERSARGSGLNIYRLMSSGEWLYAGLVQGLDNPSYQCVDETQRFLYSVHGDLQEIDAFSIHPDTGKLTLLNTIHKIGKNPVYCTLSPNQRYLYAASLQGGCITVLERNRDGSLKEAKQILTFPGRTLESVSMAHQCMFDRTGRFMFVPTQSRGSGWAQVCVCRVNPDGTLKLVYSCRDKAFTEPRHVVISPDNRFVYLADEKGDQVHILTFDTEQGVLTRTNSISALPDPLQKIHTAWPSAVLIDQKGSFLYLSNRTYASISVFSIDKTSGGLSHVQNISTRGKTPRFICFAQNESVIAAANEDSDTIELFHVDPHTGILSCTGQSVRCASPVCINFTHLH